MSFSDGMVDDVFVFQVARICHEANRVYCDLIGDKAQPAWEFAPQWQIESACAGVRNIISGEVTAPRQSHERWMAHKIQEGWTHGPIKNEHAKTHPCLVPFDVLSDKQKRKDELFFSIVQSCLKYSER